MFFGRKTLQYSVGRDPPSIGNFLPNNKEEYSGDHVVVEFG